MRSLRRHVITAVLGFCQLGILSAAQIPGPEVNAAVKARATEPGEVVEIDVTCRCSTRLDRVNGEIFGRQIAFAQAGEVWRGIVGIDLSLRPGSYTIKITASTGDSPGVNVSRMLDVRAKTFPTRRLTVAPQFVEPPPETLARIAQENQRIEAAIHTISDRTWDGLALLPVDGASTSNFGTRTFFNGQPRSPHAGIDFSASIGTPVKAPSAGRVVLAEDLYFTGNTIIIDHGQGMYSLLAHLSEFRVEPGVEVTPGQIVGLVGATGRVTGPHLHWTLRVNGARVDPLSLISLARLG